MTEDSVPLVSLEEMLEDLNGKLTFKMQSCYAYKAWYRSNKGKVSYSTHTSPGCYGDVGRSARLVGWNTLWGHSPLTGQRNLNIYQQEKALLDFFQSYTLNHWFVGDNLLTKDRDILSKHGAFWDLSRDWNHVFQSAKFCRGILEHSHLWKRAWTAIGKPDLSDPDLFHKFAWFTQSAGMTQDDHVDPHLHGSSFSVKSVPLKDFLDREVVEKHRAIGLSCVDYRCRMDTAHWGWSTPRSKKKKKMEWWSYTRGKWGDPYLRRIGDPKEFWEMVVAEEDV